MAVVLVAAVATVGSLAMRAKPSAVKTTGTHAFLPTVERENRPRLEPRILIEDVEKSYHAAKRISNEDIFDNVLIKGDNLLLGKPFVFNKENIDQFNF